MGQCRMNNAGNGKPEQKILVKCNIPAQSAAQYAKFENGKRPNITFQQLYTNRIKENTDKDVATHTCIRSNLRYLHAFKA